MAKGIREIARMTGLSPATVSNALSGRRSVSATAREAVREAAAKLGYENRRRQVERMQVELDTVKLVVPRDSGRIVDNSGFRPLVEEGIEIQARRHGLKTSFMTIDLNDEADRVGKLTEISESSTSAVVIIATEMREKDYELLLRSRAPIVLVDSYCLNHPFESIIADNETASYNAVKYLLSQGHRRIGYLGGTVRAKSFPERRRGGERALAELGLTLDERFCVSAGNSLVDSYDYVSRWLADTPELPTAFFSDNDTIALGSLKAFQDAGIDVPGDVSIIGFNDLNFAGFSTPSLTTMRLPIQAMGEMAVRKAVRQVRTPRPYKCVTSMCAELVVRDSVRKIG